MNKNAFNIGSNADFCSRSKTRDKLKVESSSFLSKEHKKIKCLQIVMDSMQEMSFHRQTP
jgi:hypothetical protein